MIALNWWKEVKEEITNVHRGGGSEDMMHLHWFPVCKTKKKGGGNFEEVVGKFCDKLMTTSISA